MKEDAGLQAVWLAGNVGTGLGPGNRLPALFLCLKTGSLLHGKIFFACTGVMERKTIHQIGPEKAEKFKKRILPGRKTQNPGRNYAKRDKEMKETA